MVWFCVNSVLLLGPPTAWHIPSNWVASTQDDVSAHYVSQPLRLPGSLAWPWMAPDASFVSCQKTSRVYSCVGFTTILYIVTIVVSYYTFEMWVHFLGIVNVGLQAPTWQVSCRCSYRWTTMLADHILLWKISQESQRFLSQSLDFHPNSIYFIYFQSINPTDSNLSEWC